jgi:SAM-dependent methyltransferase
VLDIGAGGKPSYEKYLSKNIEYIKTDYVQKNGVDQVLDFNQPFPFADASIDTVFLFHNLYIAENPAQVLSEVYRVLKKGGHVLISNPFGVNVMAEPHDYGRLTKEGLEKVVHGALFDIVHMRQIGDRFSVISYALHAFFLIWPIRLVCNAIALLCDTLIPRGMKKNHPFPLGYFYVARK